MRKTVRYPFSMPDHAGSVERLDAGDCSLSFDFHGREGEARVSLASRVKPLQVIAVTRHEHLHSPLGGTVAEIDVRDGSLGRIVIRSDPNSSPGEKTLENIRDSSVGYPEFLESIARFS
jgi:hypothetical protein